MHRAWWFLLFAACAAPPPAEPTPVRTRVPAAPDDPVVGQATALLEDGDLAGARAYLERERWLAPRPDAAALLYCGCLLAERRHAEAIDALRNYLSKTARAKRPGDHVAIHLLRHHATGGGEEPRDAREACYFGLYAWGALDEPNTARPLLARARREAPRPERALAALVETP